MKTFMAFITRILNLESKLVKGDAQHVSRGWEGYVHIKEDEYKALLEKHKEELKEAKNTLPDFRIFFDGKVYILEKFSWFKNEGWGVWSKRYERVSSHKTREKAEAALKELIAGYSYYDKEGNKYVSE